MARFWASIGDAAEWLGVEQQDIVKQADEAKLPSRRLDDGTREVQIDVAGSKGQANFAQALEVIDQTAKRELQAAGVAIGQARTLTGHIEKSLKITRIAGFVGWGLVLALLITTVVLNHFYNKSLAEKDSRSTLLSERLEDSRKQIDDQSAKLADLTKRRDELTGDRQRISAKLEIVETEQRKLSQKLDIVQKDRDDFEVDLKAAKKAQEKAEANNAILSREIIDLKARLNAASQPSSASSPAKTN